MFYTLNAVNKTLSKHIEHNVHCWTQRVHCSGDIWTPCIISVLKAHNTIATLSSRYQIVCACLPYKKKVTVGGTAHSVCYIFIFINIFVDFIYKIGWKAVCTNRSFKQGLQQTVDKNRNTIIWIEHIKESLPVRSWFEASVGIQCKHSQMNGTTQWCAITIQSHKRAYFNYSSISKVQRKITWSHLMHTCVITTYAIFL